MQFSECALQRDKYATGNNGIRYVLQTARGLGHLLRNFISQTKERDAAYLQHTDLDEIEEVNANVHFDANLQQASTSGTQIDKAPVYDSDGSAEQAQRKQQSLYNGKVLLEKHDPPVVHDSEETLQLAQESRQKMKQLNKEIKPANYTKINLLSGIFVSQTAKSQEEVYFVNTSKMATVSKSISIPNEEFLDDTTLSVARKFLNEVKSTIVTLQRVVKHRMTLDTHNWSSIAHQEIHKILKEEIFPIINQVDTRLQNFEIQFLKEAAKFVRDFKSLAKEADESLAKHKTLELEIERLLRAVCIIKKENEYAKLWNDWYKKCEECKYDKISYDKAYNDMQQKIERLQAQLGDLKGKSTDTPCVSNTLDPLSQKLENENVELEFQVRNYEKEIAHLKTTYKNLFDSISVTRAQTKSIIDSLQHKLHDTIYENAKLRAQLFDKVSDQVDTTKGTSMNTKFANQKVDKTNDLSNPVTSNSVPTPQESKNVIAPGMFRINPFKPFREEKYVPNKVRASVRTTPITVSQPHVVTKKDVNSDSNGLSSTGVDNTAKTRRPQPRSNTKNDRVHSASKSSCNKNKEVEVEEHHRNLLLSKNKKHMSSECKHVKLDIRNDKSEVVCAMCKQCLITANHDVCMLNYVNDMNSRGKKQKANVSNTENQKKQKPKVKKPKKVGSNERLASPKPSKPRFCLRWSPTGRFFDIKGKIIASSESESQSDCSNGDNACTSNPSEPTIKRFPNSTSFLGRLSKFVYGASTQFLGTVRFGNDHVAAILGFGDLQWGNILITRVYFVEGLGHNLFSVGQFCDSDLEVAFRRNTCFVRTLKLCPLNKAVQNPGFKARLLDKSVSGHRSTYAPSNNNNSKTQLKVIWNYLQVYNDDFNLWSNRHLRQDCSACSSTSQVLRRQRKLTTTLKQDTTPTPIIASSQATDLSNTSQDVDELEIQEHVQHQTENFNLAFFIAKRMEFVTKQARLILPYGMLLTRLFKYVMGESPELLNESYAMYDRVMYPLTAQQERKTRKDYGTKRGRHSTFSSSAFGQPSSSHLNDDDDDGNDEGTLWLRDEYRGGLRSIGKGIKNLLKGKKKN
ncbi:hypothetical protein Tco_0656735 [Tanacetum coccineum]|uniref:Integrase, catalytic region, zinc finger, CCHC-type, peptidase aspartic, catalytic n=1 Tax=Tanacetum coccineum TaxID=301880 RepID=A0ABQ4XAV5_9ASTR